MNRKTQSQRHKSPEEMNEGPECRGGLEDYSGPVVMGAIKAS